MYISSKWQPLLQKYDLLEGSAFWKYPLTWYEEPNISRKGTSGVAKLTLIDDNNVEQHFFLKKQCNYHSKTFKHPLRGEATVTLEFKNIQAYQRQKIPTVVPVFYDTFSMPEGQCAIILTESLEGYQDLTYYIKRWHETQWQQRQEIKTILNVVATTLRKIHKSHFMHTCFYPKHVLIRKNEDHIDIAIIDLEKNKWWPWNKRRILSDMEALYIRSKHVPLRWCFYFVKAYFQVPSLCKNMKRFIRKISRYSQRRRA